MIYSFSTKIIDCMATGCAVMAICPKSQNGLQYLKNQDAGITIFDKKQIEDVLIKIYENPSLITEYGRKAIECGIKNHTRLDIQKGLLEDMKLLTKEV